MPIHDELTAELRDAMKAKDKARLAAIRSVQTEVSRARSEPGFSGEVDDDLYVRVIASYVKRLEKARPEFEEAGERGAAQADALSFEIDYLSRWLPTALGEEETLTLVRSAIAELGVDDPRMAGRVVGHVMKSGAEGLDGALVNRLVRRELGEA